MKGEREGGGHNHDISAVPSPIFNSKYWKRLEPLNPGVGTGWDHVAAWFISTGTFTTAPHLDKAMRSTSTACPSGTPSSQTFPCLCGQAGLPNFQAVLAVTSTSCDRTWGCRLQLCMLPSADIWQSTKTSWRHPFQCTLEAGGAAPGPGCCISMFLLICKMRACVSSVVCIPVSPTGLQVGSPLSYVHAESWNKAKACPKEMVVWDEGWQADETSWRRMKNNDPELATGDAEVPPHTK